MYIDYTNACDSSRMRFFVPEAHFISRGDNIFFTCLYIRATRDFSIFLQIGLRDKKKLAHSLLGPTKYTQHSSQDYTRLQFGGPSRRRLYYYYTLTRKYIILPRAACERIRRNIMQ